MAKMTLKPKNLNILRNRKTGVLFSYSERTMENPDIEFIDPENAEEEELIKQVKGYHNDIRDTMITLKRATKARDVRWMEELQIEIRKLKDKLDSVLYPRSEREMVLTAEEQRKQEESNTNIQVNLDPQQLANAMRDADNPSLASEAVETETELSDEDFDLEDK